MHQPIGRSAQAALLTWVNTFALDRKVERLEDLADGHVFAQMLHDLDPEYDPAEVLEMPVAASASASTWLTNKRNVQSVFKALTKYIIHKDTSGAIDFLPRTVDIRTISDNPNAENLAQLVAVYAAAAMLGAHNTQYIPIMRDSLSTSEQAEIMAILQKKDEERQRLVASSGEAMTGGLGGVADDLLPTDPGLVAEAQLATLASDYDRLSKRLADSNTRLEHLQISYEQMKDELEHKERELDLERQKHGATESQLTRDLQDKLREQDELISNQEAQLEDDRQTKQRLQTEVAALGKKAALVEQMQDQVQELRHANDDLSKKANTMERYKQKLEAQRGLETDLQNALYELAQNKEALKELEALQTRTGQQQATIERFRSMVSGLEQQMEENRIQKAAIESDLYTAQVQLEGLKDQNLSNEARIAELEQQLLQGIGASAGEGSPHLSPVGAGSGLGGSLEDELQKHTDEGPISSSAAAHVELARLRAENRLLRNKVDGGSETDRLRAELAAARAKEEAAQHKYSVLFEKSALQERQLEAMTTGTAGNTVLGEVQQKLRTAEEALAREQADARTRADELADGQRALLQLQAQGETADIHEADALVSASLTKELASLRQDFRALQMDNEQQQKQLIEALVSKEELRKQVIGAGSGSSARATSPSVASSSTVVGGSGSSSADLSDEVRRLQDKNEKLRAAAKHLKKQYEAAEHERAELQRRVAVPLAPAEADLMIRNLQRENALIASAWYDLTSRLQSNHVVLQRRPDMPKSWLNKQRQLVNATPRK